MDGTPIGFAPAPRRVMRDHARPRPAPDRRRRALARARRPARPRSRHQDHWRRLSDPDRRLATGVETLARKAFNADAARLLAISGERKAFGFVLGFRSTWTAAKARACKRRVRLPAISPPHRTCHRAMGRAAFDGGRRARTDRHGRLPRQPRRGDRRACRDLHPARRAGPAAKQRGDRERWRSSSRRCSRCFC